jgi:hypothetical protein
VPLIVVTIVPILSASDLPGIRFRSASADASDDFPLNSIQKDSTISCALIKLKAAQPYRSGGGSVMIGLIDGSSRLPVPDFDSFRTPDKALKCHQ